eukprot:TRINITY_DN94842_c0_g1_i1.p2 TRINITY_DN94842_c0_g1~~TRINITY_DN94842_c0_g1_i1.p2  ORF type:complete len:110 (+),score=17.45 TRINITY_DN94842_c0_g1_i1:60-389(+)
MCHTTQYEAATQITRKPVCNFWCFRRDTNRSPRPIVQQIRTDFQRVRATDISRKPCHKEDIRVDAQSCTDTADVRLMNMSARIAEAMSLTKLTQISTVAFQKAESRLSQ